MGSGPVVQFISKPVTAPFRDGTKCLVRDLSLHLRHFTPEVLGIRESEPELPGVRVRAIYSEAGSYSPGLGQNLRAALWTLTRSRAALWHFVFAPNLRSSQVGGVLKSLRRKPVVQTVASPPKSFERSEKLLFGDIVVAQSSDTKEKLLAGYRGGRAPRIVEIPPPAPRVSAVDESRIQRVYEELRVPRETKILLYPGDIEFSHGASRVGEIASQLAGEAERPLVVMAYRDKSNSAAPVAAALEERLKLPNLRMLRNATDIHALVAASTAVLFPVEDLYGKVDLPIILLEAFRLGTPVLASSVGPLASLVGARRLAWERELWVSEARGLLSDESERRRLGDEGASSLTLYEPAAVAARYEALYRELLEGAS